MEAKRKRELEEVNDMEVKKKIAKICHESYQENLKEIHKNVSLIEDSERKETKIEMSKAETYYYFKGARDLLKMIKESKYIEGLIRKQSSDIYEILLEDRRVHSKITDIELQRIVEQVPYTCSLPYWIT